MSKIHEVDLPSGAVLKMNLASFAVSKELYQAFMEEIKDLKVDLKLNTELDISFFKDLICVALSSKKIEKALWECMKVALYNGIKISDKTFEEEEARGDYFSVMTEVAMLNIKPFMKNLSALLPTLSSVMDNALVQR